MEEVRIGVIGMGIGKANGNAFHASERSRVTALCDLDESKMSEYAEKLGGDIVQFTDYKAMCASKEVDAIFVGTPNQWHVPIAMEAIRNDKHVMITKPLADNEASARELVEAAEKSGVVNMMSLSTRFADDCLHLGKRVRDGEMGDIYYARARSIRRSGIPDWSLGFIQEGGGAFRDMGVHALDAVWWLMGMPKPLTVTGVSGAKFGPKGSGYWEYRQPEAEYYTKYAADDYAGGFIRFEGGIGLQIESFWASHQKDAFNVELFGDAAGAQLRPLEIYKTVNGSPENASVNLPKSLPGPWANIAESFIDSILVGKPCEAPLRHGLIVQEMMEALLLSSKENREVVLA